MAGIQCAMLCPACSQVPAETFRVPSAMPPVFDGSSGLPPRSRGGRLVLALLRAHLSPRFRPRGRPPLAREG